MAAKLVTDRQKSAEAVLAVGSGQTEVLAQAIGEVFAGAQDDAARTPQDLLRAAVARLAASRDALVAADSAHERELTDDAAVRARRDEVAAKLGGKLVELREVIAGLYGIATARQVFGGPTPEDPVVLARFAEEVVANLGSVRFPSPRLANATIDAEAIAASIEAERAALGSALADVAREVREAQVTLDQKTRAMAEYDRIFRGVALLLEGLFVIGGKEDLAAKVRPSRARPGRTAEQVAAEGAEYGESA